MKNLLKLNLWVVALSFLFFTSCEDDKTTDEGVEDALEAEYSSNTPEESKQDVEDAAVELVSQIDALEDEDAIDVMIEMMDLFGGSEAPAAQFNVPLKAAQILSDDSKNSAEVYSLLKATTEEGLALSDSFAAQTATYTYNFETFEFDKTENADAIVFLFPGKEGDVTNTAEIRIGDFTVKEITEPRADFDLPAGTIEFPTGLIATLKYNDNTLMSYNLSADYANDGTPTSLENTLAIGSFSFNQTLNHTLYSSASFDFSFKNGDDFLIAFGAEINGNWSESNIDDNTYEESDTYTWTDYVWNDETQQYEAVEYSETDTWTETDVEEIINNGNAYMQFMNLKAVGQVDIQTIVNGEQQFDADHEADRDQWGDYPDATELAEAENLVSLFSDNAKFVLIYTKDNTMIASLEPYVVTETYSYTWDGVTYSENDYYMDMRMVFNDDSKVSMETYFDTELTGFFNALNDFILKLNVDYGTEFSEVSASN